MADLNCIDNDGSDRPLSPKKYIYCLERSAFVYCVHKIQMIGKKNPFEDFIIMLNESYKFHKMFEVVVLRVLFTKILLPGNLCLGNLNGNIYAVNAKKCLDTDHSDHYNVWI